MLTESGYQGALIVYIGAALMALALFNVWFLPRASVGLRLLITLPLAALLLTPAYIDPEAATLAPAVVVTGFRWLSLGIDEAMHSLRPLLLFTGVSFVLGLTVFAVGALRRRRPREASQPDPSA